MRLKFYYRSGPFAVAKGRKKGLENSCKQQPHHRKSPCWRKHVESQHCTSCLPFLVLIIRVVWGSMEAGEGQGMDKHCFTHSKSGADSHPKQMIIASLLLASLLCSQVFMLIFSFLTVFILAQDPLASRLFSWWLEQGWKRWKSSLAGSLCHVENCVRWSLLALAVAWEHFSDEKDLEKSVCKGMSRSLSGNSSASKKFSIIYVTGWKSAQE